jgi:hypothetical protein
MDDWLCEAIIKAGTHAGDAFDTLLVWFNADPTGRTWNELELSCWVDSTTVEKIDRKWLVVFRCKEGHCVAPGVLIKSNYFERRTFVSWAENRDKRILFEQSKAAAIT